MCTRKRTFKYYQTEIKFPEVSSEKNNHHEEMKEIAGQGR
jgi:hypothetical protein